MRRYNRAPKSYGRGSGRDRAVTRGKEPGGIYPDLCLDLFHFLALVPLLGQTLLELETEKAGDSVVTSTLRDTEGWGKSKGR